MVLGILVAGGVAALIGGIGAFQWGEAQKAQAAATGEGKADMWRYLPWAVVAAIIAILVLIAFLALKPGAVPIRQVVG